MLLLLVVVESRLEEFYEFVDIFVVGVGVVEGLALVVDEYVEGLCVGAELAALQVAPLVAHGARSVVACPPSCTSMGAGRGAFSST